MKWRTLAARPLVRALGLLLVGALVTSGLLPEQCAGALRALVQQLGA